MPAQPDLCLSSAAMRARRRQRTIAAVLITPLLGLGVTSCTRTQVALSSAGIAAVLVGTTVGVTLAVQHHNHTLRGCVSSDADGFKLRTPDTMVFSLKGDTTGMKAGEKMSLHGSKKKKAKGDTTAQVFLVEKLNKDYGSCSASAPNSPTAAQ